MTPSQFYREIRPEMFSDTEIIYENNLPKEVLAYELETISTNQKQDEFETLCRRLAEKFIAPNLIPQVGPTGGGDGKTDSETYPVSEDISDRWFTPENGWDKNENWAFAISAKKDWKPKLKSDIKKIVDTNRGYTRVYFMTNQKISSKKKKDAQDEFSKEFNIDVVILDGEWILEKVYNNNLIELVVDSLNMSDTFKNKKIKVGSKDTDREKRFDELEKNIQNKNRYLEYDFQLVEDALESAILSRMLEKPKDEVEGKFDRALRFAKKLNNRRQLMRVSYQRAWTYINWYDDYSNFVDEYKNFKSLINDDPSMPEIENYCTLFTTLYSLQNLEDFDFNILGIDINKEKKEIYSLLNKTKNNVEKPTTSLFARTQILMLNFIEQNFSIQEFSKELIEILNLSKDKLDYPFELLKKIIEQFSKIFPNEQEIDEVIDLLAEISARRNSEIESGSIFVNRATEKLQANYYKESIVYFGKALTKLAKEETSEYLYFTLLGLGISYREVGLIWASNNCLTSACQLAFKFIDEKGIPSKKVYNAIKELLVNELFIGRIPLIFTWYEMLKILFNVLSVEEDDEDIPFISLCDGTFAVRLLYTQFNSQMEYLPDMLTKQELYLSQDTTLYKLGYTDICLKDRKDVLNEKELDGYYKKVSEQPFVEQMLYDTDFLADNNLSIFSNLLGCKFQVNFKKNKEMLLVAETLLAFLEGFLGTSLSDTHPHKESITFNCIETIQKSYFEYDEENLEYNLYIDKDNFQENWDIFIHLVADTIGRNFLVDDYKKHFLKLFKKEEVHQRLALIFNHKDNMYNILGENPKLFFDDWIKYYKPNKYQFKREKELEFIHQKNDKKLFTKYTKQDIENLNHTKVKTYSVINMEFWNKAKWKGVGFVFHPQKGLFMLLAFENIEYGKKIFDQWIKEYGVFDEKDMIGITIIKGINKKEPYSYKVMISTNENYIKEIPSDGIAQILTRFHKMDAKSPENLNNLISGFEYFKKYKLIPAAIGEKGKVEPIFDKAIIKASLSVKDAWRIRINDLERVVIQKDDDPIIPEEYKSNAPILEVLSLLKCETYNKTLEEHPRPVILTLRYN